MLTPDEIEQIPFVFIVGKGRSGTTLLQTILDANPNIIIPLESRLIINLKNKYFKVNEWTPNLINEFIADLYDEKEFRIAWNVDKELLLKNINSYPLHKLSFRTLCKIVYLSYPSPFNKNKILLIGDKKPLHTLFINDLLEIFPNSKFIHIIRDYRDNILSSRKAFGQLNIAFSAKKWVLYNSIIDKFKKKYPANFYTIRYEDLVKFPEKFVPLLCKFLEIEFHKEMFDFHVETVRLFREKKSENKIVTEIINKIHSNLMNPINTTQIDKWKIELTLNEIQLVDYIAGDLGLKYGYKKTSEVFKMNYFFKSLKSTVESKIIHLVTLTYYKSPFFIRKPLHSISARLYSKFGYYSKFNKIDFYLNEKAKQDRS